MSLSSLDHEIGAAIILILRCCSADDCGFASSLASQISNQDQLNEEV